MFTLAIFCLTVSNPPSFITLQVPVQYCSLQHRTWLSAPDTSATVSVLLWLSCFVLSLLCPFPVAYWTSGLGGLSSSVCIFRPFTLSLGFLQQQCWRGLPFPLLVDHVLSEVLTMTRRSWVALPGAAHGFSELYKPLHHNKAVIHEGGRN